MKNILAIIRSSLAISLLFLLFATIANAQQAKIDSLTDQINLYGIKNQSPVLFIHFDKNLYTNNENVWFTGYFFKVSDFDAYKTLSIALIKDDSHKIMIDNKFVVSNGLTFGNMFIPDTLTAGNYSFIGYTNRLLNGMPDVLFKQPITVKNNNEAPFIASFNVLDTSITATRQKVMLLVNFTSPEKKPINLPVSFYVGNSVHPVLKGEVMTKEGQYIFNIPSKLLSFGNNRLHARIKYERDAKEIIFDLPAPVKPALVNFYPEGGNMAAGVDNTIGWEVKSQAGNAMAVTATLYQDKKAIKTIETNSYGLGKFLLNPQKGSEYFVKLIRVNSKDTLYKLPAVFGNIPAISVPNALVNDTLIVNLHGNYKDKLYFIIHNYRQVFSETMVDMKTEVNRVKILLNGIPKGLTHLTITDSAGKPFAQRLFFAHYNQRQQLKITTNLSQYNTRQKVTLKIKLDKSLVPDSGLVSIACVQDNRIEIRKKNDIESYFYLTNDLGDLPAKENYLGNSVADIQFLENILLIKGWSKYTWTDMLKTQYADTIFSRDDIVFRGIATSYGKPIKKRIGVINFNTPFKEILTDDDGNFTVDDKDLLTPPNKKIHFIVNNDPKQAYDIKLFDPYYVFNAKLASVLVLKDYNVPQQQTTQQLQMTGFERTIQLKEVSINAKKDDFYFGNECGDYVCIYNILNCGNHRVAPGNHPPVKGRSYMTNGILTEYKGCDGPYNGKVFKGIYPAQEFYPSDFSKVNDSVPEYISTVYWKYLAKVTSEKEAEFSFYTNDISGKFRVVVQGRTGNDMIYGEHVFNVVKPK